jgi:xanthine dehydrogenase accessory factor
MDAKAVATTVSSWLAEGRRAAVANPVRFVGFSSRRPGEMLAVSEAGDRVGQVLGTLTTDSLAGQLAELLKPDRPPGRLVRVPVSAEAAAAAGLACGGSVTVALHDAAALPAGFWSRVAEGQSVALVSVGAAGESGGLSSFSGSLSGSLLVAEHDVTGTLPDPDLEEQAIAAARGLLSAGRPAGSIVEVQDRALVLEAIVPRAQLVVVGSGDLAFALRRQADLLSWHVMVFDDPEAATEAIGSIGPGDGVVVLSHDALVDTPVLAAAVASGAGYVGALGSRRTQAARRDRLVNLGVSEPSLALIHGPAGLDLGARTPEEIALAICAELLAVRSGRAGTSLRGREAPING